MVAAGVVLALVQVLLLLLRPVARVEPILGSAPIWATTDLDSCRIRNRSARTSGRSTATGRACRRGLRQWAHRWATRCTDCRLISAPTAAMVALRQPGNRRKSAIFAAEIRVNPCYLDQYGHICIYVHTHSHPHICIGVIRALHI